MTDPPDTRRSKFAGQDGVTAAEREAIPAESDSLQQLEHDSVRSTPDQLALFTFTAEGQTISQLAGLPPLTSRSSLELARTAFRRHLEATRRPANTIESYCYDLQVLEGLTGHIPLNRIERTDIARYLGDAASKSTRKRRLTSVRQFYRYLIEEARVVKFDPTEGYYPHTISLRMPVPLFLSEQEAMLAAAERDEAWSLLAIWCMLRLGLTRSELLALRRDHIDRSQPESPVVYVVYEQLAKQSKDRHLAANAAFADIYEQYLAAKNPAELLFPVGPPAINGMVERVRRASGIERDVTPQTLRTTFAVERAKAGADQQELLVVLGLVDDPRNRASVNRYLALAAEPLVTGRDIESTETSAQ
ncbi:MAG TPA: tyrosine-type recombinase/integrase [Thermomicrobiales bacterium]|nr:tyrosine-type recombinase/integrase [Thermomicrobiales bacterium]